MESISSEKTCLLRRSSPYTDESFLGYIIRLTEINRCETSLWILQRIGITSSLVAQVRSFVFSESPDVSPLCELTNSRPEEWAHLLCPPPKIQNTFSQAIFGLSVSKRIILLDHPKICPECLCSSNYHRKIWDLAPVTACPIHQCLLLDECPNCTKRISWTPRTHVSICRCGYDWRAAPSVHVDNVELLLVQQIYRLCKLPFGHTNVKWSKNNPLLQLDLGDLLEAVVCIASQYAGISGVKGKSIATAQKNKELHRIFIKGYSAFENWPSQYYEFLDWKRKQRTDSKLHNNMTVDFGGFNRNLYIALPSKSFDFMRLAFEEYLKTRWDGGLLFKKALRLTKNGYDERKYLSQKEAARIIHTDPKAIRALVKVGLLKAITHNRRKNIQYLFDREEVEKLGCQIEQFVTTKDITKLLGVNRSIVKDLVRKRCIKTVDIFSDCRIKSWRFDINEVSELINSIEAKLISQPISSKDELISFKEAVLKICKSGIDTGDFVRAILDGEISPRGKTTKKGLNQFLFHRTDIRGLSNKFRQNLKGSAILIREAARIIGVKEETAHFFAARGLLFTQETLIGHLVTTTTREAIESFNSTYVLAVNVARALGTSTPLLYSCLNEIGVNPVSGLKIDGGRQYLYRKADLEGLDLASLILEAKFTRDPRGQKHTTIGSAQACEALGITEAELVELVRGEQLQPYLRLPDNGRRQQSYLFLRTEVERYRDETIDFTGLITAQEAAEMLNESYASFCGRWVVTKRLKPVKLYHLSNKNYFLRKDIEDLIKFKKETVRSREAAAMLKVGNVTIFKWTKAGKLKAVSGPDVDGFGCNLYLRDDIKKLRKQRKNPRVLNQS